MSFYIFLSKNETLCIYYLLIDSVTKIDNIGLSKTFHHNGHFLYVYYIKIKYK